MAARYFEFIDDRSNKFWEAEVTDTKAHIRYGKIGTDGQKQTKEFSSRDEAQEFVAKKISEKLKEGYVEKSTGIGAKSKKEKDAQKDPSYDKKKPNERKLEQFNVGQKRTLCEILARVAERELASPAYRNVLDFLGIKEPRGYAYFSDETDPNLYGEVEEVVTKIYFYRLVFLAIYDIRAFFEYANVIERPVSEAIAMFDDLVDTPSSHQIDEWLEKVSYAFE